MSRWFADPIYQLRATSERVIMFGGLNRKPVIDDGEMRDMLNLSSDEFPCLTQRQPRGLFKDGETGGVTHTHPVSMIVKAGRLAVMDEIGYDLYQFFYDGHLIKEYTEEQQMIGMNDFIVLLPACEVFNSSAYLAGATAVIKPLGAYKEVGSVTVANSDYTVLTASSDTDLSDFAAEDVVRLTGTLAWSGGSTEYTEDYPVTALVEYVDGNVIGLQSDLFLELNEDGATTGTMSDVVIERVCPNLKYGMEHGNRLWAVCDDDNTIRCSKLGDPTNWEYFQGESIDAYAATQGTEGEWTGCAAYSTHLLFFKEDHIHKVYGAFPAEFQVVNQEAYGVERGSEKSIAIMDDYVMYKSKNGITIYAGDRPELMSASFAMNTYKYASAGVYKRKLYVNMINEDGTPEMLVYDMSEGIWHKEDNVGAECFVLYNDKLMFADENGDIRIIDGGDETDEEVEWFAELGPFDEFVENKKVVSRLKMRYTLDPGAYMDVYVKCDQGEWELAEHYDNAYDRAGQIRIVPRRCDSYGVKLLGVGRCRVEGLVRQYREARGRY